MPKTKSVETVKIPEICILRMGKHNNVIQWREAMYNEATELYGEVGSYFHTNVSYRYPYLQSLLRLARTRGTSRRGSRGRRRRGRRGHQRGCGSTPTRTTGYTTGGHSIGTSEQAPRGSIRGQVQTRGGCHPSTQKNMGEN
jgi:hypothetical protein